MILKIFILHLIWFMWYVFRIFFFFFNFTKEPIFINFTLKLDFKATLKSIIKAIKRLLLSVLLPGKSFNILDEGI